MAYESLNDEALTELVKNNSSEAITELARRHRALMTQIGNKYAGAVACSGISLQDLLEDELTLVFEAAKKFNPDKGIKFSTWLGNNMRYHCLNEINRQVKYFNPNVDGLVDKIADKIVDEENHVKSETDVQLEYVKNLLDQISDDRVKQIITMRYFNGGRKRMDFRSIAAHLSMSIQGVVNLHNSFIQFAKEKSRATANMDKI